MYEHMAIYVKKHFEECKLVKFLPVITILEERDGSFSLQNESLFNKRIHNRILLK